MSSQFAARSVRLGQIFADPLQIEVPPYQRSYAWTATEASRLLDDIALAMDTDGAESADYFLGTMLFIDSDQAALLRDGWPITGSRRIFEVIDGLQRLTTLTILFCVLRDLDAEGRATPHAGLAAAIRAGSGTGVAPRLTLRGTDEKFFQAYVRAAGACRRMPDSDRLTPAEQRILEVREHFLTALLDFDAAQRRRLVEFLLEHCAVVLVATMGIDRAHRMFMVLNETGKPLARNDILKAELLGSIPGGVAGSACATWDAVEARLGAEFESLFSHVRTMYGRSTSQVIAGIRAVVAECGGAEAFIGNVLAPSATILDDLRHARHAGSVHSADIARTLTYLSWLPASDWIPPAMLWWLANGKDPAELAWFLQRLDRLAYGMRILGLGASRRAKRFGTIIAAIRNGSDLKASGSPLNLLREEIRNIEHSLRDLHARSAPLCKLVLLRINDELAGRPQNLPIGELTVEHVLPRKHGTGSAWRGAFPDAQEREQCTEALGNLVLVSKAQNDKAGNLDFARKHAIYFAPSGGPTLAINEYVRRQKQWTSAQVRERDEELMKRLQALWGFGGEGRRARASAGLELEGPPAR
ncbi:MAG: DUF262 domain-containing HNH endonuclease family protein [Hyphomicrobiaceae bacterium]|jgi:hypothetical protein